MRWIVEIKLNKDMLTDCGSSCSPCDWRPLGWERVKKGLHRSPKTYPDREAALVLMRDYMKDNTAAVNAGNLECRITLWEGEFSYSTMWND